jgi:hypothetical protein
MILTPTFVFFFCQVSPRKAIQEKVLSNRNRMSIRIHVRGEHHTSRLKGPVRRGKFFTNSTVYILSGTKTILFNCLGKLYPSSLSLLHSISASVSFPAGGQVSVHPLMHSGPSPGVHSEYIHQYPRNRQFQQVLQSPTARYTRTANLQDRLQTKPRRL